VSPNMRLTENVKKFPGTRFFSYRRLRNAVPGMHGTPICHSCILAVAVTNLEGGLISKRRTPRFPALAFPAQA